MCRLLIAMLFRYTCPSSVTAPIASSGLYGARSFPATMTSRSASSALAISAATATPPLGRPTITGRSPEYLARSLAKALPAADLSSYGACLESIPEAYPLKNLCQDRGEGWGYSSGSGAGMAFSAVMDHHL